MTEAKRVPVVGGLFAETADGPRLLGSRCGGCGTAYFPKALACHNPDCTGGSMQDAALGPRGKLWSFAVQHYAPPAPAKYDEPYEAYAMGSVDLPEGLRVLGKISTTDLRRVKVGMDVELVLEKLYTNPDGAQVVTWKFRPL